MKQLMRFMLEAFMEDLFQSARLSMSCTASSFLLFHALLFQFQICLNVRCCGGLRHTRFPNRCTFDVNNTCFFRSPPISAKSPASLQVFYARETGKRKRFFTSLTARHALKMSCSLLFPVYISNECSNYITRVLLA